jgi:hypothetical protein
MAQLNWIFLDNQGGRHRIGLYHGDRTGHVMIHCNLRVVQIDFSVKETRAYSFFIEEELCEVRLVKERDERFSYEFVVNKKVDTPLNRVRRADERRTRRQMLLLIVGLATVVGLAALVLRNYGQRQQAERMAETSLFSSLSAENAQRLQSEGRTATARLLMVHKGAARRVLYAFRTADSLQINGQFIAPDTGLVLLPTGFPLSEGDEFEATYWLADPRVHRVDFSRPMRTTVNHYLEMATRAQQREHPQETPARSVCTVLTTAESKGWPCLADFIFQKETPLANARHNRESYSRLLHEPAVAKAIAEGCWDK